MKSLSDTSVIVLYLPNPFNSCQLNKRTYEAVDELPKGKQMQVDFGEITVSNTEGNKIKLYGILLMKSVQFYQGESVESSLAVTKVDGKDYMLVL